MNPLKRCHAGATRPGSIKNSLKVEVVKKVELQQRVEKEKCKLVEIRGNPEYDDGIREDIRKQITKLNDDLSVRQESIDLLKEEFRAQCKLDSNERA